jgi:asparagine synthase (glutamine-hydrolysing)
MCGFSGLAFADAALLSLSDLGARGGLGQRDPRARFLATAARLAHRGGDDEGAAALAHAWLAHHRLAFQDVSAGRQPFVSGDATIVFNGEIYNHLSLRDAVARSPARAFSGWRTRSDTETLLEGFLARGPALQDDLDGEYAFVVVEDDGRRIRGCRDAFGVKPLFLWLSGVDTAVFAEARSTYIVETPTFAFASEVKALPCPRRWNRDGALRQACGLFEPLRTPFEGIVALPAGGNFEARLDEARGVFRIVVTLSERPVRASAAGRYRFAERDLPEEFASAFAGSVTDRLLSDVELGVYLSGGVDSKAVGHELGRHLAGAGRPALKSFTIGFESAAFDETAEALSFARAQGFTPHSLAVSDDDLAYAYPIAVAHSENLQPYTNGAAKWWLSRFTREHVHGVLTGDGADELLCGYPSFRYCAWWKFALRARKGEGPGAQARADSALKGALARLSGAPLGSSWRDDAYVRRFLADARDPWIAGSSSAGRGDDFLDSLALWGVAHPLFGQIRAIARAWMPNPDQAHTWLAAQGPSVRSWFLFGHGEALDPTDARNALLLWQNYFCKTHLPVQVLNWVGDRMEMANTLEGRTPFLSRRLRAFVESLSDGALVAGFTDKAVLRHAYTPRLGAFARTPKKQFGAPFLDNARLLARFPASEALSSMGLDGEEVTYRLLNLASTDSSTAKAGSNDLSDAYERTHRAGALQTLVTAGIVDGAVVREQPLERDLPRERQVLARGKVFSGT